MDAYEEIDINDEDLLKLTKINNKFDLIKIDRNIVIQNFNIIDKYLLLQIFFDSCLISLFFYL